MRSPGYWLSIHRTRPRFDPHSFVYPRTISREHDNSIARKIRSEKFKLCGLISAKLSRSRHTRHSNIRETLAIDIITSFWQSPECYAIINSIRSLAKGIIGILWFDENKCEIDLKRRLYPRLFAISSDPSSRIYRVRDKVLYPVSTRGYTRRERVKAYRRRNGDFSFFKTVGEIRSIESTI